MADYHFDPMTWEDDEDGGSVGNFYGTKVALECSGYADDPVWCIVFGNSRYGYQRGGREGERTLDDIKRIAEADAQSRAQMTYERALDTVAAFEKRHLKTEIAA